MRHPLLFSLLLALPLAAPAQQRTTYYHLSSGTGFVINAEGDVVTNDHVVQRCKSISILTPAGEQSAELVAHDSKRDLALLKTPFKSQTIAPLRWNIDGLEVGEDVVVMGFPGQEGAQGRMQTKTSKVTALTGPSGEAKWIQLESVAAHGNSGGPVLDRDGNVIAVITGMALRYHADRNKQPVGAPIGRSDIAITLHALQDFLWQHGVHFRESANNAAPHNGEMLRAAAQQFIVPVRCVQSVETR